MLGVNTACTVDSEVDFKVAVGSHAGVVHVDHLRQWAKRVTRGEEPVIAGLDRYVDARRVPVCAGSIGWISRA